FEKRVEFGVAEAKRPLSQTVKQTHRQVVGCRIHLTTEEPGAITEDAVGKRSSNIDVDSKHRSLLLRLADVLLSWPVLTAQSTERLRSTTVAGMQWFDLPDCEPRDCIQPVPRCPGAHLANAFGPLDAGVDLGWKSLLKTRAQWNPTRLSAGRAPLVQLVYTRAWLSV